MMLTDQELLELYGTVYCVEDRGDYRCYMRGSLFWTMAYSREIVMYEVCHKLYTAMLGEVAKITQ